MKKTLVCILVFLLLSIEAVGCGDTVGVAGYEDSTTIRDESDTDPDGKRLATPSDTDHFPLYAKIEEDDIYLYGMDGQGMILHHEGTDTWFDWPGLTPRFILPQMAYYDFDGDGIKDIAVTLYWGSGTGVSMMDLHIVKISDNRDNPGEHPIYTDCVLPGNDAVHLVTEPISAVLAKDGETLTVHVGGSDYEAEALSTYTFTDVIYGGGIVGFSFEGTQIRAEIGIAALYEEIAPPQFIGQMEANVVFDGERFFLEDYSFVFWETST